MSYKVMGCLGSLVGVYSTVQDAMIAVLSQVPIKPKTQRQLANRLARARAGDEVYTNYGSCQIIINVT